MHVDARRNSFHLDGNLLSVLRVGAHAALQAVLLCVIHRVVPQVSTCLMEYLLLLLERSENSLLSSDSLAGFLGCQDSTVAVFLKAIVAVAVQPL